jgi:uncharacterized protein (TIGR02444 family)
VERRLNLWDFAVSLYGRPGVEATCLTLQDDHGHNVPILLWRLWALDRHIDASTLRSAVDLARDWDERAVAPLRAIRRGLAAPAPRIADGPRSSLREAVKSSELAAERILLESLETLTPQIRAAGKAAIDALTEVCDAWSRSAPLMLLAHLADASASVAGRSMGDWDSAINDDVAPGEDDASIRVVLGDLRLAHQDLDAAIAALEAGAMVDQLQIARLKKRKLGLRDQITRLEERLTPDIIA